MRVIDLNEEGIALDCPFCKRSIAKLTSYQDATPHKGDLFYCPCGKVSVLRDRTTYRAGWILKKPTWDEQKTITDNDQIQAIISRRFVRFVLG